MVQTSVFPKLTQSNLSLLSGCSITRKYSKNTILINEGDLSDSLYIILSGKVKVYLSDENGKEVLLSILGPGEYFGELALLDAEPRSASVMTTEPSRISVVTKSDYQRCIAAHPEIAFDLIQVLAHRIRVLTDNVKNLALLDVYGRVARTLLNMAIECDGKLVIQHRLTHQDIASMVGASREMVSRIMKDLATGGYIKVKDKQIILLSKLPPGW
jgi:CRP/FNR family cyclic AMP-dependent transcriptional regulator